VNMLAGKDNSNLDDFQACESHFIGIVYQESMVFLKRRRSRFHDPNGYVLFDMFVTRKILSKGNLAERA
jgi:hypothetical protein